MSRSANEVVEERAHERVGQPASGRASLIGADQHPHAANRLRDGLPSLDWTIGPESKAAGTQFTLRADDDLVEGAWRIAVHDTESGLDVDVSGGPFSGVIQGVEALLRCCAKDGRLDVAAGTMESAQALPYRLLWTWDHSTHWDVDTVGLQETGAFNPYMKQAAEFVGDYERLVDFASLHGIGGVVIYGLLRDSHGGVEAANAICRYARARGVRILAGIAINAYGGIYYEGDHPYNLATWLRHHPDLAADVSGLPGFQIGDYGYLPFPSGEYTVAALPDRPENERWHLEGLEWLLSTVDIDGLNIEFGDYAGNDALSDMRRLLPGLLRDARRARPDMWLVGDVGWDALVEPDIATRISGLPDGCAYQHTYNRSYWPRLRSELTSGIIDGLPTRRNLLRPHAGSQWNRQRYAYMATHYADLAGLAHRTGLDGVTIFGEVSDHSPPNELSYLAFARFANDPNLDWEAFERDEVFPRLGGPEPANRFLDMLGHVDADDLDMVGLATARDEVREIASTIADPMRERWSWLEDRLGRRIHSRRSR